MRNADVIEAMARLEREARAKDPDESIADHRRTLAEALPGTTEGVREGIRVGLAVMVPPAVGGDPVEGVLVGFALGVKLGRLVP